MRIVVVGGTGLVGSTLVEKLCRVFLNLSTCAPELVGIARRKDND